jgi:arabinogalactan oligomer / maltooligosaccharide transport system substrate-binding protein/arabinogalactan oligomer / maltooligosaccharide transport system permease protein
MIKSKNFIFLLIFFVSAFWGCQHKEPENEIVIWHNMRPEEKNVLQKQIDEYMKLHPGIKIIQLYKETEEMRSGYIIAAIAGQGPDLIYGPSDQVGPFADMEIIKPLESIFSKEYLSHFNDKALINYKGHLWQLADKLGNHLTLVYNKDLVPVPPKTDKELIEIGKKLTKDFNHDGRIDQYGLVWNYTEPYFFIPFLTGFGGWVLDSTNAPTLNTPAMVSALKFIADLRDKYKIIPGEADYDIADVLFKEGKAGMIINGDWSWSSYGNAGINYGISILPLITETGKYATPMVAPKGYSINKNVSDEKLAEIKDLLKFLMSPEKQLETALQVKTFPSRKELYTNPQLANDEIFINSKNQIDHGIALPIVTEMRAIWDAMRPSYQAVLGGATTPEKAAKQMQEDAVRKIKELREDYQDPVGRTIIFGFFFFAIVAIVFFTRKSLIAFFKNFKRDGFAYYLLLPAMLIMLAVILYPFIYNIILSFSNMSLAHMNDWSIVGFYQYVKVFAEPQFYEFFLKTIIWTGTNIVFHVTLGVTLALLINRKLPGSGIFRTLLILPWAIPQYIVALTWRGMFNYEYGAINLILVKYLSMSPVEWLKSPVEAFSAAIITNIWLGFPFMMIIALGALQSIPHELYEAADIDGARWYHKLKSITIPLIKPVMIPAITLGVIWTFNNINVIWLVTNAGEPSDKSHILVSYVYKAAFNLYRYGYAAAFSVVIFLILLAFGLTFLRRTKATESVY